MLKDIHSFLRLLKLSPMQTCWKCPVKPVSWDVNPFYQLDPSPFIMPITEEHHRYSNGLFLGHELQIVLQCVAIGENAKLVSGPKTRSLPHFLPHPRRTESYFKRMKIWMNELIEYDYTYSSVFCGDKHSQPFICLASDRITEEDILLTSPWIGLLMLS